MNPTLARCLIALVSFVAISSVFAQAPAAQPPEAAVVVQELRGNVYLLTGRGGNIALFVGDDGALLVDNQFAPRTAMIQEAVAKITSQPIRWVVNTHWHFDHSDGNENFGAAGAVLISQENSRRRMETGGKIETFKVEQRPYKPIGLPSITFAREVSLHRGSETVDIVYPGTPAHSDGDAFILFRRANVVHTGDVFVRYWYPFLDTVNGGSLKGTIHACEFLLDRIDDETLIIPGHGPISKKSDLFAYKKKLQAVHDRLAPFVAAGKKPSDIVDADPLKDIEQGGPGNVTKQVFIFLCLESMMRERK